MDNCLIHIKTSKKEEYIVKASCASDAIQYLKDYFKNKKIGDEFDCSYFCVEQLKEGCILKQIDCEK